jgi:hypothetical protein
MIQDRNTTFRINILFLIVAIGAAYYFSELRLGLNIIYENATPAMMVEGTAETPYQLRVLLPWMVQGLLGLGLPDTALMLMFRVFEFLSSLFLVIVFRAYLSLFFQSPSIGLSSGI